MKNLISTLLVATLVMCLASFALARGAPIKQNVFTVAAVAVDVAPIVASVPPMTVGYDVICNLTTANTKVSAVTTATRRLSTTVDWRGKNRSACYRIPFTPEPALVLLA